MLRYHVSIPDSKPSTLDPPKEESPCEVRFADLERQHHALCDELWGDELGLAKAGRLAIDF